MTQKPIFLVLTDSIALPRKHKFGVVFWHETYIAQLREAYPDYDVINVSIGGASIKDLKNQVNYYKVLNPEIVLLQFGIVDAAPRAFGRIEMEIIKKLRIFRLTKFFVPFLRKYRSHNYTSPKVFEQQLKALKSALNSNRFYSFGILPSCNDYEAMLPGVTKNITVFNAILKKHTDFIDLNEFPIEGMIEDHHHINAIGHAYCFKRFQKHLGG